MKSLKKFAIVATLAVAVMFSFVACGGNHGAIDDLLNKYEAAVEDYQDAVEDEDLIKLAKVAAQIEELDSKYAELSKSEDWTSEDTAKFDSIAAEFVAATLGF